MSILSMKRKLRSVLRHWKLIIILVGPLVASIFPIISSSQKSYCAFTITLMSIYWCSECLPIGVTSLLPILLFPLFGILPSKVTTKGYFQDIVALLFGGLVMASAIEISGLHQRISLRILMLFGSNPKWLMLGFMCITGFLSMWISNSASCSMMLPMVYAVVRQLVENDKTYNNDGEYNQGNNIAEIDMSNYDAISNNVSTAGTEAEPKPEKPAESEDKMDVFKSEKARRLATGFLLSCSYSSSMGGLGSLVGTGPNLLLKGFFDENYPNVGLNLLTFGLFAAPISVMLIFLSWLWLSFRWLPREYLKDWSKGKDHTLTNLIREKYESLGKATWEQICVGVIFIVLITLWITRDLHGVLGWGSLFKSKYVTDATPAIFIVFVLFACPKKNIFKGEPYEHLIGWKKLQELFPWNVVLLIGGGLVVAEGFQISGLSDYLGENLQQVISGRKEVTLIIVMTVCAIATEFTSNTSMASIFLPIINSVAVESKVSSVYLLLPLITAISLAFMLPVATPTNALVFANGYVRMKDMITTGIVMNIIGLAVVFLAANTWLGLIFDLSIPVSETTLPTLLNRTSV